MEYHSARIGMLHATTRLTLKDIMLSERRHKKPADHMIPFTSNVQKRQIQQKLDCDDRDAIL